MATDKQRLNLLYAPIAACLLSTACASKVETRQTEVDRYEALETQLIDERAAEERRRRSEMRVAERLRQIEVERAEAQQKREEARALAQAKIDAENTLDDAALLSLPETPVVTNVVVANSSDAAETNLWSLRNYPSPIDGSPICAVVSRTSNVSNGTLDTNVSVVISADSVYLRTDATFDPDAPETGFRIDAGIPILFNSYHNELTAVIDKGYARLRNTIESGSTLTVAFAYSPQLSTAETHVLELSLETISNPLAQLESCETDDASLTDELVAEDPL